MNRFTTTFCVALLVFAAVGAAWATTYTVAELAGDDDSQTPGAKINAYGIDLLPNGTVMGETLYEGPGTPPPLTATILCSWSSTGAKTELYNLGAGNSLIPDFAPGDSSGRFAVALQQGFYIYSGGTRSSVPQLNGEAVPYAMSGNGLVVGCNQNYQGFAYDANTQAYYTFGVAGSSTWAQAANSSGYAVGADETTGNGFIWYEGTQSYNQISGLSGAWAISNNSGYVAGVNHSGQAVVYTPSGALVGTYGAGEATGVNDSGVVIGDTSDGGLVTGDCNGRAWVDINGQQIDLTTAYAPAGVTFNCAIAINDAGQILVQSNGAYDGQNPTTESYLLTPVPEPSAILLSLGGLLGLLAYAWRRHK